MTGGRTVSASPLTLVGILLAVAALVVSGLLSGPGKDDGSPSIPETPQVQHQSPPTQVTTPATTTTEAVRPAAPVAPVPTGSSGVFVPAPGQSEVTGTGPLVTYSVEVEQAVALDPAEVAAAIDATLGDPRSWTADGTTSLQRVPAGGKVRFVLATPATVDRLCAPLQTNGIFSCRNGGQVNLNSDRWLHGTADWPLGNEAYRSHVVNHELGHALGHGHLGCPGPGALAPVMMQQTKGLGGCLANPWPFPDQPSP